MGYEDEDCGVMGAAVFDSASFGEVADDCSVDAGSNGSRRMGTESRYGRMAGSMLAVSSRFFHLDGVKDGVAAKREIGKAPQALGAEYALPTDVVNGRLGVAGIGARGKDCMICFNSSRSLVGKLR